MTSVLDELHRELRDVEDALAALLRADGFVEDLVRLNRYRAALRQAIDALCPEPGSVLRDLAAWQQGRAALGATRPHLPFGLELVGACRDADREADGTAMEIFIEARRRGVNEA